VSPEWKVQQKILCGGAEGDQEVEEPVVSPGPAGRWGMWAGSGGLPLFHGRGKTGAALGENGVRGELSDWELWERLEEREVEAEALGAREELPRSSPRLRSCHRQACMRGRVTLPFCSFLGKFP